ncbi:MAG: hypothetical protein LBD68_05325 [Zoogloeaceae bacterium]|jgi:hypothetical protein|nr:hypothetical protein [Zoogloeaceae bacterium]
MTKDISIVQLQRLLIVEGGWFKEHAAAPSVKKLNKARSNLSEHVERVGKSGDLSLIAATEKAIIEDELTNHANNKGMVSSLGAAIGELTGIERLLRVVDDKQEYSRVDQACSFPKNREKGLPLDEARQAFKSRHARLNNLDRARLSEDEKKIIDARKRNVLQAGKLYAQRQAKTLGVDADLGQKQHRGIGR